MKRMTEWINLLCAFVRLIKELLICLILIGRLYSAEPTVQPDYFESKLPSTSLAESATFSSSTRLNS